MRCNSTGDSFSKVSCVDLPRHVHPPSMALCINTRTPLHVGHLLHTVCPLTCDPWLAKARATSPKWDNKSLGGQEVSVTPHNLWLSSSICLWLTSFHPWARPEARSSAKNNRTQNPASLSSKEPSQLLCFKGSVQSRTAEEKPHPVLAGLSVCAR